MDIFVIFLIGADIYLHEIRHTSLILQIQKVFNIWIVLLWYNNIYQNLSWHSRIYVNSNLFLSRVVPHSIKKVAVTFFFGTSSSLFNACLRSCSFITFCRFYWILFQNVYNLNWLSSSKGLFYNIHWAKLEKNIQILVWIMLNQSSLIFKKKKLMEC